MPACDDHKSRVCPLNRAEGLPGFYAAFCSGSTLSIFAT
jgi:hypothetical protein